MGRCGKLWRDVRSLSGGTCARSFQEVTGAWSVSPRLSNETNFATHFFVCKKFLGYPKLVFREKECNGDDSPRDIAEERTASMRSHRYLTDNPEELFPRGHPKASGSPGTGPLPAVSQSKGVPAGKILKETTEERH